MPPPHTPHQTSVQILRAIKVKVLSFEPMKFRLKLGLAFRRYCVITPLCKFKGLHKKIRGSGVLTRYLPKMMLSDARHTSGVIVHCAATLDSALTAVTVPGPVSQVMGNCCRPGRGPAP